MLTLEWTLQSDYTMSVWVSKCQGLHFLPKLRHPLWTTAWHFLSTSAQLFWFLCFLLWWKRAQTAAGQVKQRKTIWYGHWWLMISHWREPTVMRACLYVQAVAKSALIDIMQRSHTCKSCVTHCSVTTQKTVIRHGCKEKVTILLYIDYILLLSWLLLAVTVLGI